MKLSPIAPAAGSVAAQGDRVQDLAASLPVAAAVVAPDVQVGVQAASVQRAQVQAAQMPDVDAARVAEIKEALARGDISFNPQKLAQLILRHHGGGA
ncbi:flagellar biosynthesis anti-sigma factor FlgM [Comamonas terrigena]|jgi:negative regulator of flagellin synthesis FlgM|uniref:flagellar biosynthesis anti-sigma factor FlgM n=1 Tax=Comamonas terrigena TaxID=32013 RepID=UPI002357D131|nr:flagellar biosynthesis anti-sigma factor FlgM [Comamonas terrigena]MDH0049138.1 flagellar biosynthesis anti-sigma factor FlgM [Comamonas terrigena]MDH0512073.1 flagellar biosynthesis anti-sigma factor FlgM [Comamonas terrigena]MDH1091549.1 flagellar biosynthesis anti-sigma factor FlgM [Comamonas terrigena]MDH1292467.1 flagellar biosynthesis anti-sigma factor FlgM [Comamonas terrigena]MDH1500470.1 flagellar biosynthesis anti-sigma factor FlgM [Comamonas terrigena]